MFKNYRIMTKKILFSIILFISSFNLMAQKEIYMDDEPSFFDRVYTGGGFSMSFGTITYVDVSPIVGYMITEKLSAGFGVTYRYYKDKRFDFSTNIYGGRLFARYNIAKQFFVHTEYENLSFERFDRGREWIPGFFVGGGFSQPIGNGGAAFNITALYNLSYQVGNSPYNSPWVIRAGITL